MFAWFRKRFPQKAEDPALRERVKTLEDRWDVIETEWNDWYEKFRLLHLRLAKRQKAIEAAEHTESVEPDKAEHSQNGGGEASPTGLTDHQREMQQKILRLRARM